MTGDWRLRTACLIVAWLACSGALAQLRPLDVPKSQIGFVYTLEQKIEVEGRFPAFSAEIVFDERHLERARIAFEIDLARIDTGSPEGDAEAKRPLWFDTARFARARFTSSTVRRTAANRFEALGTLELKGQRRELTIPFEIASGPAGGLTARGAFTLRRLAFGIGEKQWADVTQIADAVQVRFKLAFGAPK